MANPRKISKINLNINDQDYPVILGIVCPDPDYKLSMKLNKKLGISLRNSEPVVIPDNEGNTTSFSRFFFPDDQEEMTYHLVSNRSAREFLLRKLKNIDYILTVNDPHGNLETEKVIANLKEIDSVTGVFFVEAKTLKDKNLKYLV